jgi:hypothetical protein
MDDAHEVSSDVWCDLLCSLPRHHYPLWGQWLPEDGLLTFWEEERCGERLVYADPCIDATVARRLEDHYGPPDRLAGSRSHSALRRSVGAALIRAHSRNDARLAYWLGDEDPSYAEVEALTSGWLRKHVCFRAIASRDAVLRRRWAEAMLRGTACRSEPLSRRWLGKKSPDERVREGGIWVPPDSEHPPMTPSELAALSDAVEHSLGLNG